MDGRILRRDISKYAQNSEARCMNMIQFWSLASTSRNYVLVSPHGSPQYIDNSALLRWLLGSRRHKSRAAALRYLDMHGWLQWSASLRRFINTEYKWTATSPPIYILCDIISATMYHVACIRPKYTVFHKKKLPLHIDIIGHTDIIASSHVQQLRVVFITCLQQCLFSSFLTQEKRNAWRRQLHACADTPPWNRLTPTFACVVGSPT